MRRKDHRLWFSTTVVLLVVLVITVLAVSGLVIYQRYNKPSSAKNYAATNQTQTPTQQQSTTNTQPAYANWHVYSDTKHGFSFSYPSTWRVEQGDPASSVDEQNTELVLWLVDPSAPTTQNKTVYIEVSSRDLASKTAIIDSSIDSEGGKSTDYKQSLTLKGKEIVKYTIPQSATVNRVMYFFAVGAKTYSVQTFYEETNLARTPDYKTKFNNLVNSLVLPQ